MSSSPDNKEDDTEQGKLNEPALSNSTDSLNPDLNSTNEGAANTVPEKVEKSATGKAFTDTFKDILSSVLKTNLGLVLKNRNDKNNAQKTSSDSSKSSTPPPLPVTKDAETETEQKSGILATVASPIVTRASSKCLVNDVNGVVKSKKELLKEESNGSGSQHKSNSPDSNQAKPNRARKSVPKALQDVLGDCANKDDNGSRLGGIHKPNTRRSSRNVYNQSMVRTSTGKKKKAKFKGGTYHLGIKPKKKKKTMLNNSSKPASENTSVDDNGEDGSLANLDDTSEDMSVRIECEELDAEETTFDGNLDVTDSQPDNRVLVVEKEEMDMKADESSVKEDQLLMEDSSVRVDDQQNSSEDITLGTMIAEASRKALSTDSSTHSQLDDDTSENLSPLDAVHLNSREGKREANELAPPKMSTSGSTEALNEQSSPPNLSPMRADETDIKQEQLEDDDDDASQYNNGDARDFSALRDVTEEDRNTQNQIMKSGEYDSSEKLSIASSVKRLHGLKRKTDEIDDFDSVIPLWAFNEQSPKRAKKAVTLNLAKNEDDNDMMQAEELTEPELLLCTCQEMCTPAGKASAVKQIHCQAVDDVDDRLVGCCNVVKRPLLNRSSHIMPFMAMCELHRSRLRAHHCCPGCGIFCTQGVFVKCNDASSKAWHLFHERCCLISNGQGLCPHCGLASEWIRIRLRISMSKPLVIYPKQQLTDKQPSARMVMVRGNEMPEAEIEGDAKQYKISNTGKEISLAGLPVGPDRAQLESMLVNLALEKPMNLRYTIKSMYNAAKSNDVEKIFHMLAMGFDPNHKFDEHDNETAIHAACDSGHLVMVHVLHQAGAYLDAFDNKLRTPLMHAVENKHASVLQYLMRAGVYLGARGEDGMTVLHLAAKAGHLDICHLLLQSGQSNANILDDGGWTPIVWACEHRHKEVVRYLLDHGSDPNIRDNEQNIALHWAAFSGGLDVCEMLLNRGCEVFSVNEHGDTPLHIAARQDNYDCVILFLARGADIDIKNKEYDTPQMCCPDESSQTWMALSMNAKLKWFSKCRTSQTEILLHKDVSMGKEQISIPCINGVDDESFPVDYLYVTENCETSPMNVDRSIVSLQNCQCTDDCSSVMCSCSALSLKCWYMQDGGLAPEFNLLDPPMIFECNRACRCWKNCNNRVVQHGITSRLQLFRTKGKGWGVRTLRDIPRGTFICEYIGEVISDSEADHREDDSYLFDLDNRDGETYCIDARYYGNISRFINHLCEPNLVPVKVFIDHQDLRFPRIAFFSSRDINAYEELGFDYGEKFWIIKYKAFTCMCDTEKCKYSADKIQEMLENYMRRQREEIEITGMLHGSYTPINI